MVWGSELASLRARLNGFHQDFYKGCYKGPIFLGPIISIGYFGADNSIVFRRRHGDTTSSHYSDLNIPQPHLRNTSH